MYPKMTSLLNSYGMAVLPGPSPVTPGNTWSVFVPTYEYNAKLRSFIHSVDALKEGGYVVDPLTDEEILAKRRCENCHSKSPEPAPALLTLRTVP